METYTANSKVSKISTSVLLSLLALSAFLFLLPIAPVLGSTGHPSLGTVDQTTCGATIDLATTSITVPAGHVGVTKVDTTTVSPATNLLAVIFNGVTFSGGQFYMLASVNGFASQSAGDVAYSPTFQVSDLTNPAYQIGTGCTATALHSPSSYSNSLGQFYVGSLTSGATTYEIVVGPAALLVNSSYNYIKIYDGSTGAEAATAQLVLLTPGITVTPNNGPALTQVVVTGGGFADNKVVNINYTFPFYLFSTGAASTVKGVLIAGQNTGPGYFHSASTAMVDTKQAYNPHGGPDEASTLITLFAVNASLVSQALSPTTAPNYATFKEWNRYFTQVHSWTQAFFSSVYNTGVHTYGNDTGTGYTPIIPGQPIPTYVFSPVVIAGGNFSVSSAVTFWIGKNTQLSSTVSTTTATGSFNTTVTIPVVPTGTYTLIVHNDGVNYTFTIDVLPTVILMPPKGTASNPSTTVTVEVYGFPASIPVYFYWNATSIFTYEEYSVVNITTTSSGETNTAGPDTFVVPESYGGPHAVYACASSPKHTGKGVIGGDIENEFPGFYDFTTAQGCYGSSLISYGVFSVEPSLTVTPGSFNSTYGGMVTVIGEGFNPLTGYSVNIDNQMANFAVSTINSTTPYGYVYTCFEDFTCWDAYSHQLTWTEGDVIPMGNGLLNLTFIGAGFNPGLHVISVTNTLANGTAQFGSQLVTDGNMTGDYGPNAYALFTVTPVGNWEYNLLNSINASLTKSISGLVNLPTTLQNELNTAVTSINSNTNSQISSLSTTISGDISSAVSSINSHTDSDISSLTSTISGDISSAVSSINSHTDSDLSSITSAISSLTTSVGTISTTVAGLSGLSGQVTNVQNSVNTEQTYVLVVAVLAAIVLVLVLAVLIRKLS